MRSSSISLGDRRDARYLANRGEERETLVTNRSAEGRDLSEYRWATFEPRIATSSRMRKEPALALPGSVQEKGWGQVWYRKQHRAPILCKRAAEVWWRFWVQRSRRNKGALKRTGWISSEVWWEDRAPGRRPLVWRLWVHFHFISFLLKKTLNLTAAVHYTVINSLSFLWTCYKYNSPREEAELPVVSPVSLALPTCVDRLGP